MKLLKRKMPKVWSRGREISSVMERWWKGTRRCVAYIVPVIFSIIRKGDGCLGFYSVRGCQSVLNITLNICQEQKEQDQLCS